MMPHIWHRKTYKEKLDYHWHLLTSNICLTKDIINICVLSVSLKVYAGQMTFLMSTYIYISFSCTHAWIYMYLHVGRKNKARGQQTTPPSQKLHHTWNCRIQIWIHKKVLQSSIPKNFQQFCYFNQLQLLLSFSNGAHARR